MIHRLRRARFVLGLVFPALLAIPSAGAAVSEAEYFASLQKVFRAMEYKVHGYGKELFFVADWKNDRFVAQVNRSAEGSKRAEVEISGGAGRSKYMTADALELIACHEIGHHVGGAPRFKIRGQYEWLNICSLEGESDYFASLQCAKLIWRSEDNVAKIAHLDTNNEMSRMCRDFWRDEQKSALCIRTVHASLTFQKVIRDEYPGQDWGPEPDLNKFDPAKVETTNQLHPHSQCRLDTALAGALCDRDPRIILTGDDWNRGKCARGIGARPRCWFRNGVIREEEFFRPRDLLRVPGRWLNLRKKR